MFMFFIFYLGFYLEKCICVVFYGFCFDYVWIDCKYCLVFSVIIEYL